jgi:hypothetical protein
VRKERGDNRKAKKNNDAEKRTNNERNKTEAAEKKDKDDAQRAKKVIQTRGHNKAQNQCRRIQVAQCSLHRGDSNGEGATQ